MKQRLVVRASASTLFSCFHVGGQSVINQSQLISTCTTHMSEVAQKHRILSILLACFQNMTLGGIFYGWASISGGLLVSNVSDGGAGLSAGYVHMIFVVASFCNFLGPLVLGFVLDAYGPRACSVLSIALITVGSAMFAFSDHNSLPLFAPGMCLIAFGGPGTQNAIIHLSNLFPEWKATATSFIVGSFQLSFIVFFVFDQLWLRMDMSYSTLFMGYCVICVANVVISLVMWPDQPYHLEVECEEDEVVEDPITHVHHHKHEHQSLVHMSKIRLPSVLIHRHDPASPTHRHPHHPVSATAGDHIAPLSYTAVPSEEPRTTVASAPAATTFCLKEASFNEQIMSREFILLTLFFLVNSFWANFYIGTFDMQLGDKHNLTGDQRHTFAEYFTLVITLGVVSIPPVGAMMDRTGFPATSLLCLVSGIIWALLLLADSPERHLLMLSFVFYSLYRTSFFTFFFAYLADVMGFQFFGMLGGIIFLLAGVLGMLQYPLAQYATGNCHILTQDQATCDKGRWAQVNTVMVLMITSTLYFTYCDYERRAAADRAENALIASSLVEMANKKGGPVGNEKARYGSV